MGTANIKDVNDRAKLKPQREPYYTKIKTGCYLGFRKMTSDTSGVWVARCRIESTGKQAKTSLGRFDELVPSKRYDAALDEAEKWFKHLGMGGSTDVKTVKNACEEYVKHIKDKKGNAQADEIEARFKRWVYPEPLARSQLMKLNKVGFETWRKKLAATEVIVNPHAKDKITRPRSAATLNRDMAALRAALNHAHTHGNVMSDISWLAALKPVERASKQRDLYLDIQQRRDLVNNAPTDLANFLKGMSLVPLRPGALAALTVASFDKRLSVLTIGKDKAGQDRKIKLPKDTAAFFKALCTDKLPAAPLFTMADGRAWIKDYWKGPIKAAAKAAGLPDNTTAYTLRHSTITDLVQKIDLLTVAQLSGTSVEMIQAHYGHLQHDRAAEALAGLAL